VAFVKGVKMLVATVVVVFAAACTAVTPVSTVGDRVVSGYSGDPLVLVSQKRDGAFHRALRRVRGATPGTYRVQKGDTLWAISQRLGGGIQDWVTANNLSAPNALRIGQDLRVPASALSPLHAAKPVLAAAEASGAASVGAAATAKKGPLPQKKATSAKATVATKPAVAAAKSKTSKYPLIWPVEGSITSRYGRRWGKAHDGIDIQAKKGTAVSAAAAGEVLYAARNGSYGNLVVLRHDDGLVTVYAHSEINLVRKGQRVTPGQLIARVGQTGRATGPHLHFEVRKGTRPTNPLAYLPP